VVGGVRRSPVIKNLQEVPGRQLVIVKYTPAHSPHHEWVYNRADIDSAQIVWARSMGPEKDAELVRYFHDRHAWILYPDGKYKVLVPFSAAQQPADKISQSLP